MKVGLIKTPLRLFSPSTQNNGVSFDAVYRLRCQLIIIKWIKLQNLSLFFTFIDLLEFSPVQNSETYKCWSISGYRSGKMTVCIPLITGNNGEKKILRIPRLYGFPRGMLWSGFLGMISSHNHRKENRLISRYRSGSCIDTSQSIIYPIIR